MAGEPRPGPAMPGQKRQHGTAIFCSSSNYNRNLELHREVPYRMYEYQRISPLISQVPSKMKRTHMGGSPNKGSWNRYLCPRQIKQVRNKPSPSPAVRAEELHSIRAELSRIKAQVDSLLESLEHMDHQQRDQPSGIKDSEESRSPGSEGSSCRTPGTQQEPQGQRAHLEADSCEGSTDTQQVMKSQAPY